MMMIKGEPDITLPLIDPDTLPSSPVIQYLNEHMGVYLM